MKLVFKVVIETMVGIEAQVLIKNNANTLNDAIEDARSLSIHDGKEL